MRKEDIEYAQTLIKEARPQHVVAATIWGEARGEGLLGQLAVACVIRNRTKDRRWPRSYKEVCLQKYQFSCWLENDPNYWKIVDRLLPHRHEDDDIYRQCRWIAGGYVNDQILEDVVKGANHYFAQSIPAPYWASPEKMVAVIGHHKFYKL